MLLSEEVEVLLQGINIKYYEEKGYEIPRRKDKNGRMTIPKGTTIKVKVNDLPLNSHTEIKYLCDYCLEEGKETIVPSKYQDYTNKDHSIINKDACFNCKHKRESELNLIHFGVKSPLKLPEIREKIENTNMGRYGYKVPSQNLEVKEKMRKTVMDRYGAFNIAQSDFYKINYSGENSPNWKGGITKESKLLRHTEKYKIWKIEVFNRDKKVCQCCGKTSSKNQPHHIYNFSQYPELRFDVNNGITLCIECHASWIKDSFHNSYGTKNNNYEQLKEYIEQKIGVEWNWPYINQINLLKN